MSDAKSQGMVRTRFAPSPSGHLHVGGARTALFNWAFARHHGGKFILRIEDTDQKRSSGAASVDFLKDLKWLGIEWDEGPMLEGVGGGSFGPYFQSERLAIYTEHAERLIAAGKAYRAFETPEELDAARDAARKAKQLYRYDRASLGLDAQTIARYLAEGRPHVVRFKLPDDDPARIVSFHDEAMDTVMSMLIDQLDDFVIVKADGYPTYHFAVVVDDGLMEVSHVIRAQEHLGNTFKHILLEEALGFARPSYAHVSIIFNPDGSKMSKRDKAKAVRAEVKRRFADNKARTSREQELREIIAKGIMDLAVHAKTGQPLDQSGLLAQFVDGGNDHLELAEFLAGELEFPLPEINVDDFRRAGYLPEVLVNFLALLGWNPGGDQEKFDADFLVKHFSMDRIIKSPAKFDRAKLLAFNLDALQAMPPEVFVERLREHAAEFHPEFLERFLAGQFALFATCNQSRSKTLEDPFRSCRFMIVPDEQIVYEESKAVRKALDGGQPSGLELLEKVLPVLEVQRDWSHPELEKAVTAFVNEHVGGNLGRIAQPLRIAVSGGPVSPAIFETLSLLGRDTVVNRIRRCVAWRREAEQAISSEPRP